jgi:hypothetical protein
MTANDRRVGTCIHEAAHAVISHLLGVELIHVAVVGDSNGEVVPESSRCPTCLNYYHQHNPAGDPHSRRIQDDFRRSIAIAVAGELADTLLPGGSPATDAELARDRSLARSRASAVLMWKDTDCYLSGGPHSDGECADCDAFIASVREVVHRIVNDPDVSNAIVALAQQLESRPRLSGKEMRRFLEDRGLDSGVAASRLPPAPG